MANTNLKSLWIGQLRNLSNRKSGVRVKISKAVFAGTIFLLSGQTVIAVTPLVPTEGSTPEQKMAVINAHGLVPIDDVSIARFGYLLETFHELSGKDRERIGDMLVVGHGILLSKFGKNETLLEFSEAVFRGRQLLEDAPIERLISITILSEGSN